MHIHDFIEIQRNSFFNLLKKGLIKEINNRNPITSLKKDIELFFYPEFYQLNPPNFTNKNAILKAKTYACKLYIPIQLINNKKKQIKTQWVLLTNFPLMTKRGHFIINGSPRIIINQIIRSPGIYYQEVFDKKKRRYYADLISSRGTWLRLEIDKKKAIWAKMKKTPKISILILLQAMGLTNKIIFQSIQHSYFLKYSLLDEENPNTTSEALLFLYSEINPRKDETLIKSSMGQKFLFRKFMNPRTYDLSQLGRIRLNEKLGLSISKNKTTLTPQDLLYATDYLIKLEHGSGKIDDIDNLKNRRVRASGEIIQNQISIGLIRLEKVIRDKFKKNRKNITIQNLITTKPLNGALREFFGSSQLSQFMDQTNPLAEITHKRRLTSIGPNGISRETAGMSLRGIHPTHYGRICPIETPEGPNAGLVNSITSYAKINSKGFLETPFYTIYKGQVQRKLQPFFFSAEEEENKILISSDIHSSKLSFLPKKKIPIRFGTEMKQANPNEVEYSAISQIQMISLATSLIPFLEHNDANRSLMGSNMQRQAVPLMKTDRPFIGTGLEGRIISDSDHALQTKKTGYISYVSGEKIIIHNVCKQKTKKTFCFSLISSFTNFYFSRYIFSQKRKNTIYNKKIKEINKKILLKKNHLFVTKNKKSIKKEEIFLHNFQRSNQETTLTHRPSVSEGNWVQKGDLIADSSSSVKGEISLGKNILLAYMPWEGYNFEDAVLINERLVYDDVYTSIHIERFELELRDTKFGIEKITNKIPEVPFTKISHLNENGIAKIGSWVEEGTILIGKVTPIKKKALIPHEKLLYDIIGKKTPTTKDSSLRAPKGLKGRVIHIEILETKNLPAESLFEGPGRVHIYIAEKRKIQVGDKISGRHGNKGIISKILPRQDMPFLPDGTPVDMILNPLGVPSRMNVGQILECLLGLAGIFLNEQYKITPFDEKYGPEASRSLVFSKLYASRLKTGKKWLFNPNFPGKIQLFDGRTGNPFDQHTTIGQAYILKLVHLVDDKIHARSTGPYSLVTQQPLRGRSKHGGQRLGEMEVWALEGFGSAYILQELITIKSDDMKGRHQVINAILKNKPISLGTPEAFKVLIKELQSLCLDIIVYTRNESKLYTNFIDF